MKNRRFLLLGIASLLFAGEAEAAKKKRRKKRSSKRSTPSGFRSSSNSGGGSRKFGSCAAARAAGYSRMRPGDEGYSLNLDRDRDGIACE